MQETSRSIAIPFKGFSCVRSISTADVAAAARLRSIRYIVSHPGHVGSVLLSECRIVLMVANDNECYFKIMLHNTTAGG